jgi:transposase
LNNLKRRWSEGCHNAALLFQELQALGFIGSYYMVRRQLAVWRKAELTTSSQPTGPPSGLLIGKLSSRRVTSLLLKDPNDQRPEERAFVEAIQAGCPESKVAIDSARALTTMVRERKEDCWEEWLARVIAPGGVKELRTFAEGLRRDESAVRGALRLEWSIGPVVDAVNRLKTI